MKSIKQLEKEIKEKSKMFGWTSTDGFYDLEARLQTLKEVLNLINYNLNKCVLLSTEKRILNKLKQKIIGK